MVGMQAYIYMCVCVCVWAHAYVYKTIVFFRNQTEYEIELLSILVVSSFIFLLVFSWVFCPIKQ